MKHFLKAATMAALAVATLTAASQPQQDRYRYLGRIKLGVLLATEATGPQNARRIKTVIGSPGAALPGGADNAEVGLVIDCQAKTAAVHGIVTYLGDVEKLRMPDTSSQSAPIAPGSSNELAYAQACGGTASLPIPAVWIDGAAKARAYARAEALKK